MSPEVQKKHESIRLYIRMTFCIFAAVLVSLILVTVTVSSDQIDGCMRGTADRVDIARSYQVDASKEYLLAVNDFNHKQEYKAHWDSAASSDSTAHKILSRAGSPEFGIAPTTKERRDYCEKQYGTPVISRFIG